MKRRVFVIARNGRYLTAAGGWAKDVGKSAPFATSGQARYHSTLIPNGDSATFIPHFIDSEDPWTK